MKSCKLEPDAFEAQFPNSEKYEHAAGYERPFSHEVPQHFAHGGFANPNYSRKRKTHIGKALTITAGL